VVNPFCPAASEASDPAGVADPVSKKKLQIFKISSYHVNNENHLLLKNCDVVPL
jgi:hypothetical protein